MRYMKEILKNNRKWVIVYLTLGLFNAFMSNYKADYFQKIVDGLTDRTITFYGILFYGVVLIVNYGMNYLDNYPDTKLGNEIYLDFKLLALRKIGRMDYSEYQKLGTGKLIQQIENGATAGKGVLYNFWFNVVRNLIPTILFSLYFIWKIDRNITYFLLAGYIVVFLVTNLLLKGLYQVKEKILTNEEELNHFLVRGFMEMPVFRMKHQFPNEIRKALKAKRVIVSSKIKMTLIHEAFFTIFAVLVACLDVGILAYAWKNSHLSVGSVVALITLIDNAYMPIAIFNVIYVQYRLNKTAWQRFTGLLDLKEDRQLQEGIPFETLLDGIHVENLSFSYETSSDDKIVDEKPFDEKLSDDKIVGEKPSDEKLSDDKIVGEKPSDEKLSDDKIVGEKSSDEKLSDDKSVGEKSSDENLSDGKIPAGKVSVVNKKVLQSVSLTIRKGEKVAFVGESGSGKSTLAKILIGFLKYDEGNVLLDEESLKKFSLESLYEKASYLSQDAPVFDGTIRENLIFDREISDADIYGSLEGTQLLQLVASLEQGLDTRIGEKGTCLSGGEKQRLALARLWFDYPEIVVLDEATSALDNVTESIVMKNVLEQVEHATVIAIAHRLSSIIGFDRIFVFRDGRIAGEGTFEELLTENGYFQELYRKEKEKS